VSTMIYVANHGVEIAKPPSKLKISPLQYTDVMMGQGCGSV